MSLCDKIVANESDEGIMISPRVQRSIKNSYLHKSQGLDFIYILVSNLCWHNWARPTEQLLHASRETP